MEMLGKGVPDGKHSNDKAMENTRSPWKEVRGSLWLEDRASVG